MSDIVERLQEYSVYGDDAKARIMAALAKTEIERLRSGGQTGVDQSTKLTLACEITERIDKWIDAGKQRNPYDFSSDLVDFVLANVPQPRTGDPAQSKQEHFNAFGEPSDIEPFGDLGKGQMPSRAQLEAASKIMNDEGFDMRFPWECSLDDIEKHRYETFVTAISAALSLPSPTPSPPDHIEKTEAGIIDWKMEVERLNRLLAAQQTGKPIGRQWIIDMIRDQFDPKPSSWKAGETGWDDGTETIADSILANLPLLHAEGSPAQSSWQPILSPRYLLALEEFISQSEADYCSDATEKGEDREPDDEPVASGQDSVSAVTFGSVRHAREAIDALKGGGSLTSTMLCTPPGDQGDGKEAASALPSPSQSSWQPDEDHPDCKTDRERELYDALMGLSSAVTARQGWSKWVQGGVQIAPIVHKALRLSDSSVASTDGQTP